MKPSKSLKTTCSSKGKEVFVNLPLHFIKGRLDYNKNYIKFIELSLKKNQKVAFKFSK